MLNLAALLAIALTTLVVTAVVTGLAMLVLRTVPQSIASRGAVVITGSVLSIAASTIAVATEMYLSDHDLAVLSWVIGISSVMSLTATWVVTGRSVRASIEALIGDTRRVGDGAVGRAAATGGRECDRGSAELAETSQRLAAARTRIGELDAARRQFFAWISHDLRTPLAGMRAMAEALEEGTAPDPQEYVRTIRSKVDTVNQMVGDLFELSRLQSGTLELRPEPVVLLDLVSDAVADVQALAGARGITVAQDGIEGHMIWADPRELTRAIGNLLANSLRYAPDDSTVLIRVDPMDDPAAVVLSVIDQGPGVTTENLGHLFDVGWRADPARTDSGSTGAGLGLAIVRGIVEAHGGTVRARHTEAGFQLDLRLPAGQP